MLWKLLSSLLILYTRLIRNIILNFKFGNSIKQFGRTLYIESNHLLFDELSHILWFLILKLFIFHFFITLWVIRVILLLFWSKQFIRVVMALFAFFIFFIFFILIILLIVTFWLFFVQGWWKTLCFFFGRLMIHLIYSVTLRNLAGIMTSKLNIRDLKFPVQNIFLQFRL